MRRADTLRVSTTHPSSPLLRAGPEGRSLMLDVIAARALDPCAWVVMVGREVSLDPPSGPRHSPAGGCQLGPSVRVVKNWPGRRSSGQQGASRPARSLTRSELSRRPARLGGRAHRRPACVDLLIAEPQTLPELYDHPCALSLLDVDRRTVSRRPAGPAPGTSCRSGRCPCRARSCSE